MLIIICVYKGLQCEGRKLPPKLVHVVCRGRMELLIDLSGCALITHGIYTNYIIILSLLEDIILLLVGFAFDFV